MSHPTHVPRRRAVPLAPLLALLAAPGFVTVLLWLSGTPVLAAWQLMLSGWASTAATRADTLMLAAPLLLCAAGLTITFAAGLYNLGIEGQVTFGAIGCMAVMRAFPDWPTPLLWATALAGAMLAGAIWAGAAALLRRYGRVSEIFAGLGLNFLAIGCVLYLVAGPWKKSGSASITGTEPLPRELWLPTFEGVRLAPVAPALGLLAIGVVWLVLARSRWGLEIRAVGINAAAAERLGVPAAQRMTAALAVCGTLAGLAGGLQALAVFHALVSNVSSGIGLLALLVVLLVDARPAWVLPVALTFAAFAISAFKLPLALQVDSSLGGVVQGALVLCALIARALVVRRT
jgi:simple sugar transport system permease protein